MQSMYNLFLQQANNAPMGTCMRFITNHLFSNEKKEKQLKRNKNMAHTHTHANFLIYFLTQPHIYVCLRLCIYAYSV